MALIFESIFDSSDLPDTNWRAARHRTPADSLTKLAIVSTRSSNLPTTIVIPHAFADQSG
ncbi:MAG: hypothetical protein IPK44_15110 [Candidatus Accumulibacter sp.]|uniref:hypothetical protein n=1 Tax=Accumulibacter sp. TaxID=2053492 RepID=UPI0025894743|nr:hypothetical protein [Accumulibacter sp.]MBK8115737.1 hypothetical protein [Accumulibacter sp.]